MNVRGMYGPYTFDNVFYLQDSHFFSLKNISDFPKFGQYL